MLSVALIASSLALSGLAFPLPGVDRFLVGTHVNDGGRLLSRAEQCTIKQPSCQNTTTVEDMCCFEHPGGLLMQTQFWDSEPANGPEDSWTIHGLWPDKCDGGYEESCDPARSYDDISAILNDHGAKDTLDFMSQFWLDNKGDNEKFWKHEWNKHGTCMSTLEPTCLPNGDVKGADAVVYFQTTVKLFQGLPTHKWLADGGIKPSDNATYTRDEIVGALKKSSGGATPELGCKSGRLNHIGWYFNVKGSVLSGDFLAVDTPDNKQGSCPENGIRYPPKGSKAGESAAAGRPRKPKKPRKKNSVEIEE
ncbi:hypothetical protein HGRIS_013562 [Hohenbuehelia grisea]|uniref:ribonuclease T2 n=1 Tax=Hohenbuehelia grisea TaxID=104357 RepID=A0ABR3IVY0_9AGAR